MLGHHWYHGLIRKYIATFGTLFNDITIRRYDETGDITHVIKVPLIFSQKDKLMVRLTEDPNIDREAAIVLPVIAFEMGSPFYDSDRKLISVGKMAYKGTDANHFKRLFNPVPYNIPFSLFVYTKNSEDGTKIVEQILPMFKPEFTVSVYIIPEVGLTIDVPVELGNVTFQELNEGSFKNRRVIQWQLDFTLKGFFYGPVVEKPIIKFVNSRFYATSNTANADVVVSHTVQPGLDANGDPTTILADSIDANEIWVDDDYGYIEILDDDGPTGNT